MDDTRFAGVQNTSGATVTKMYGGISYTFEKDEIKVVEAHEAQFLLGRNHITSDGKIATRKFLFKSIPLIEALKHAKAPENKSIAEAKKSVEAEAAYKAKLKAEVIAELKAEGAMREIAGGKR